MTYAEYFAEVNGERLTSLIRMFYENDSDCRADLPNGRSATLGDYSVPDSGVSLDLERVDSGHLRV